MEMFKVTILALFMSLGICAGSGVAYAEDATASTSAGVGEAIASIEKAIAEIKNSDFNAAQVHLKAARAAVDSISSQETVKKANALVIQGQIIAKKGEIDRSIAELNKALELYRSL